MLNEMIEFPGGVFGLALNLEENEVGAVFWATGQNHRRRRSQDHGPPPFRARRQGPLARQYPGQPVDGKGPVKGTLPTPVEKIAPGIIKRKSVSQPVQTGIMAIDAMIPIGRGQRELIIGDRATGQDHHRH